MMERATYEKELINHILESIHRHGGSKYLSAVILTGSFGRNEPSFGILPDGSEVLLSDVEIALVYPNCFDKKAVEEFAAVVSSEFEEELNLMPIQEKRLKKAWNYNFSVIEPKYKTLFTYDLYNGSKTIWGRDFLQERRLTIDEVDPYEAKRLVANRIAEYAFLQFHSKDHEQERLRQQWKGKIMLAIASAWLLCEKKYVSSYCGQHEKLQDSKVLIDELLGVEYLVDYKKTISYLRENGSVFVVPDERLVRYVKNISRYFEDSNLLKSKVNSTSRTIKYLCKYINTKGGFGLVGFENAILQALLDDYCNQSSQLKMDAEIWRRVLY